MNPEPIPSTPQFSEAELKAARATLAGAALVYGFRLLRAKALAAEERKVA